MDNLNSIIDLMGSSSVSEDVILSYKGQSLKLNNSQDGKKIADDIAAKKGMTVLTLEGNTLGVDAAEVIGDSLKMHSTLKKALWSDLFTGRMKSEIPIALQHLSRGVMTAGARLTVLDLSDNAFGPNGMKGIVDLLSSSACYRLEVLKLNNNGLGTTGGKMLAKCLMKCFEDSSRINQQMALKVFVSGRGRLEDEGTIALSAVFKRMGSLEEISMPQNGITHIGILALSEALSFNLRLRRINLSDNTFTEAGARAMAKTLRKLKHLESIDFGDCLLRNGGSRLLAQSFSSNRHVRLESVNLSFNEILVSGAELVFASLQDKPVLRTIHLDGNMLGEEGIEILQEVAEAAGKTSLLGEFGDDEGIDSDEDGELTDTEYNLTEGEISDEESSNSECRAVDDFLSDSDPSQFSRLSKNRGAGIVAFVEKENVDVTMNLFVKISDTLTLNDTKEISSDVSCCLDALFETLFSQNKDQASGILANNILCRIGIIKSEDKSLIPVKDITTSLYLLCNTVKKHYFDESAAEIIYNYLKRSKDHNKLNTMRSTNALNSLLVLLK